METRRRRVVVGCLVAAAAATAVVGVIGVDRNEKPPGPTTPSSTVAASVARSASVLDAIGALARLPRPRQRGRILFTTGGCRLGVVDLGDGAITRPRPDVKACTARWLAAPAFAFVTASSTDVRVLGPSKRTDRRLNVPALPLSAITADGATFAGCFGQGYGGQGTTVIAEAKRRRRYLPGCWPVGWQRRLIRISHAGRVVDRQGHTVIRGGIPHRELAATGALGASPSGKRLLVLGWLSGRAVVAIYDRLGGRPTMSVRFPAGEGPPHAGPRAVRLASDATVMAAAGPEDNWTLWRLDRSVPPLSDIAGRPILDVAFAPDAGSIAVIAAGRLVFLDPTTLAPTAQIPLDPRTIDWTS